MGTPGFIYVLENSSIPNCVKIGKTINDPSNRAAQLSSATGVPLPFAVTYDAYFKDCDLAEVYVHALLEARGLRLSTNREFFSVPASEAIAAIKQAEAKYGYSKPSDPAEEIQTEFSDPLLSEMTIEDSIDENDVSAVFSEPWFEIHSEAADYSMGTDDILQDTSKAVEKFKIAAKLGSAQAYVRLANIYAPLLNSEWVGLPSQGTLGRETDGYKAVVRGGARGWVAVVRQGSHL